jgi:hypothetical protein
MFLIFCCLQLDELVPSKTKLSKFLSESPPTASVAGATGPLELFLAPRSEEGECGEDELCVTQLWPVIASGTCVKSIVRFPSQVEHNKAISAMLERLGNQVK